MINKTAILAENSILSVYLLLRRYSLHFTTLHSTAHHSTSVHFSTLHFHSFKLHRTN